MMSNWKENITPGECGLFKAKKHHEPSLTAIDKLFVQPEWAEREFSDIICEINHEGRTENQQMADGKLIEETFNVTNETGKTHRELQQERDEALEALQEFLDYHTLLSGDEDIREPIEIKAKNIKAKIEGDQQ
jgi:hypothetical protein